MSPADFARVLAGALPPRLRPARPDTITEPIPDATRAPLPKLPPLLVRPGRQPDRDLDAVGQPAVARPRTGRHPAPARPGARPPVPAVDVPGAVRWRPRRSHRQAQDADGDAVDGAGPGVGPVPADLHRRGADLACLRAGHDP